LSLNGIRGVNLLLVRVGERAMNVSTG